MRYVLPLLAGLIGLSACGDDDANPADASVAGDAPGVVADAADGDDDAAQFDAPPAGTLVLTSTVITEGGSIPVKHSCDGDNVSPPLAWTGGPEADGYAIVFTDITNDRFLHSVIWDIPGDVDDLPEGIENVAEPDVPDGAKQTIGYDRNTRGYLGPCPGGTNTYEFALYAVGTNPLPGVTLDSSMAEVEAALQAEDLAKATLTATYERQRP